MEYAAKAWFFHSFFLKNYHSIVNFLSIPFVYAHENDDPWEKIGDKYIKEIEEEKKNQQQQNQFIQFESSFLFSSFIFTIARTTIHTQ